MTEPRRISCAFASSYHNRINGYCIHNVVDVALERAREQKCHTTISSSSFVCRPRLVDGRREPPLSRGSVVVSFLTKGPVPTLLCQTSLGIQKLLANLKPHTATGPDLIPPTVLKELSHEISPILEIIFNMSLQTGQVPNSIQFNSISLFQNIISNTGGSSGGLRGLQPPPPLIFPKKCVIIRATVVTDLVVTSSNNACLCTWNSVV